MRRYIIVKLNRTTHKHLSYYVSRRVWSSTINNAMLFRCKKDAQTDFDIMPTGEEIDAAILDVELTIDFIK